MGLKLVHSNNKTGEQQPKRQNSKNCWAGHLPEEYGTNRGNAEQTRARPDRDSTVGPYASA